MMQNIADLISNLAGANYALGEYVYRDGKGKVPEELMIGAWKDAGCPDGFLGHSAYAWELADEIKKTRKQIRRRLNRVARKLSCEKVTL